MSGRDTPAPADAATVTLSLTDQSPAARLAYLALRTTDAETRSAVADHIGVSGSRMTQLLQSLRDDGVVRGENTGPGRPAGTYTALVPCPECDEWYAPKGVGAHYAAIHAETSPKRLAEADPEDLGLSPIGERRTDGGRR